MATQKAKIVAVNGNGAVRSGDYAVVNIIERATSGGYTLPPAGILPA
jgi:hypothetical protein